MENAIAIEKAAFRFGSAMDNSCGKGLYT